MALRLHEDRWARTPFVPELNNRSQSQNWNGRSWPETVMFCHEAHGSGKPHGIKQAMPAWRGRAARGCCLCRQWRSACQPEAGGFVAGFAQIFLAPRGLGGLKRLRQKAPREARLDTRISTKNDA
jgi:hypothetical protein